MVVYPDLFEVRPEGDALPPLPSCCRSPWPGVFWTRSRHGS